MDILKMLHVYLEDKLTRSPEDFIDIRLSRQQAKETYYAIEKCLTLSKRTNSQRIAYIDGFNVCASCVKAYLTDEGKEKLKWLVNAINDIIKYEDEKEDKQ